MNYRISMLILALTFACQPIPEATVSQTKESSEEAPKQMSKKEEKIQTLSVLVPQAMVAFFSAGASIEANTSRGRLIAGTLVVLATYGVADLLLAHKGLRNHLLSLNIVTASGDVSSSISRLEMVRHLRQFHEFYLNQNVYDLIDDDGKIHDTFLRDLIEVNHPSLSVQEKRDLVRQILTVMKVDESTNRAWLAKNKIEAPIAIQLHRAMNGLWEGGDANFANWRYADDESARAYAENFANAVNQNRLLMSAEISVMQASLKDGTRSMRIAGMAVASLAGGAAAKILIMGDAPLIEIVNELGNSIMKLRKGDLAATMAAYRLHFANKTIDDVYDAEEGVIDPFAEAFLGTFSQGSRLTPLEKKDVLEQLLIIAHADRDDSHETLQRRGVRDSRFLELFDTWRILRGDGEQ